MDLQLLIAQWSGKLPPSFVPHAVLRDEPEECSQPRCRRKRARKPDGGWYASCQACLCLLYTSPSPRDGLLSRMPSSA